MRHSLAKRLLRRFRGSEPRESISRTIMLFSIDVWRGDSPLSLRPDGRSVPALTRDDVSDMRARIVADPFMIGIDGTWYMFFEAYDAVQEKGLISVATSADGARWRYQGVVLEEPYHLSYPYVFEWKGEYYMVPESAQTNSVSIYRAEDFPRRWKRAGKILEGAPFADATLFRTEDSWWLFAEASPDLGNDTLRLFHAEDPVGPWSEHPGSPIVRGDAKIARPAGRPVKWEGRRLRFAQNCSTVYGSEVRAFEILSLTPGHYSETPLNNGNPILAGTKTGWNACGMHHLDPHPIGDSGWIACVDGWTEAVESSS